MAKAQRKAAAASPERARPARRPIAKPPEVAQVSVSDLLSDRVMVIPRTGASLILGTGRVSTPEGDATVLLPYVEMRLAGFDFGNLPPAGAERDADSHVEAELRTIFSATVPVENAAFVLLDLMADLKRICTEITSIEQSGLSPEPTRMAHLRYFVAHLERQAGHCRRRLDSAYGVPPEEAVADPKA